MWENIGVLLRRLMYDPHLQGVSHVFVDEIHERGMNEDFLLIILKDLLKKRSDIRLVLMSATLNARLFSNYFGGAPTIVIPGFTFPIEENYLENILEKTGGAYDWYRFLFVSIGIKIVVRTVMLILICYQILFCELK